MDDRTPPKRGDASGVAEERRYHRRIPALGPATILSIGDDDKMRSTEVQLQDFSEGGYGVITEYKLPVGELVWLQRGPEELHKAVVRYSKHAGGLEWRTGLHILGKERRRAERDRVAGMAFLTWVTAAGARRSTAVTVTDISETGAGVIAEEDPPAGILATLQGQSLVCSCFVRHCRDENGSFRIGLMFTAPHKNQKTESDREWLD